MQKTMVFNPQNLHMKEVTDDEADKLKDAGWIKNPSLVAMYHPGYNDHKTVLRADQKTWENKGYYAEPTVIYHPQEAPDGQTFPAAEAAKLLGNNGWVDTPAEFTKAAKQALEDTVVKAINQASGVTTVPVSVPGTQPPSPQPTADMTKAQLIEFASKTYGIKLEEAQTKAQMLEAIEAASKAA